MTEGKPAHRKFLPRTYDGQAITVVYDVKRCLHAAECVRRAPAAFDKDRLPWIIPDAESPEAVVEAVLACPTGALRFEAHGSDETEPISDTNVIWAIEDGPLYIRGDVELVGEDGQLLHRDSRLALCRCGQSGNKPFCDNTHLQTGFRAGGLSPRRLRQSEPPAANGTLSILPSPNGSYKIIGAHSLVADEGSSETHLKPVGISLCRCGHSGSKPHCDGSHRRVGFTDPGW